MMILLARSPHLVNILRLSFVMSRTPCGRTGRVESFFFFYRSCSFEKENITGLVVSIEMIQLQWTTK